MAQATPTGVSAAVNAMVGPASSEPLLTAAAVAAPQSAMSAAPAMTPTTPLDAQQQTTPLRRSEIQALFAANQHNPPALMQAMIRLGVSAAELSDAIDFRPNAVNGPRRNEVNDGRAGQQLSSAVDLKSSNPRRSVAHPRDAASTQMTAPASPTTAAPVLAPPSAQQQTTPQRRSEIQALFVANPHNPPALLQALARAGVSAAELSDAIDTPPSAVNGPRLTEVSDGFAALQASVAAEVKNFSPGKSVTHPRDAAIAQTTATASPTTQAAVPVPMPAAHSAQQQTTPQRRSEIQALFAANQHNPPALMQAMMSLGVSAAELSDAIDSSPAVVAAPLAASAAAADANAFLEVPGPAMAAQPRRLVPGAPAAVAVEPRPSLDAIPQPQTPFSASAGVAAASPAAAAPAAAARVASQGPASELAAAPPTALPLAAQTAVQMAMPRPLTAPGSAPRFEPEIKPSTAQNIGAAGELAPVAANQIRVNPASASASAGFE
ncbi:MAG: hypothetical protein ACOYNZ_13770, partial [Rhodoferax sp.]